MSLKELISTLIESVFTSKKSYIATQCLPNGNNILQEHTESVKSVVVPFDGWVRVQARCNVIQVDSGTCVTTINNQNSQWPSIVLPVKKGANLTYNVLDGLEGKVAIWFIHNQTNE